MQYRSTPTGEEGLVAKMPDFYKKVLSSGLVVLFEKRNAPVVNIVIASQLGSAYEHAGIKGISHYVEHSLFKGTKKYTKEEMSSTIEKKGGILNGFTSEEFTAYWVKLPSKHFGTGIDVLSDLVTNPLLNKRDLEMERQVVIEEAHMYHDNPQFFVLSGIKNLLYKKPFGMGPVGTEETIKNIKHEDILKFFKRYRNKILVVVGDADFEEIVNAAEAIPNKKQDIGYEAVKTNSNSIAKRDNLQQSHIAFGFHIPSLTSKERYNTELFDAILADGMSSRLFQEIREKRALAYAVKSRIEQGRGYGYYLIYAGTEKKNVPKIKEIMLREIKGMKNITQKEFEDAREQMIGQYELMQEDSTSVALALLQEEAAGDAEEFYRYEQIISELRIQDIKEMSRLKAYSFFALVPK